MAGSPSPSGWAQANRADRGRRARIGGRARAACISRRAGGAGWMGRVAASAVPAPHCGACVEHRLVGRGRNRDLRGRRDTGGVVRRADGCARPALVRRPRRHPARHPRLRGEFRLARHLSFDRRVLGGRPRHVVGRLSARVPPSGCQPSLGRPGAGGGRTQPRLGADPHVLDCDRRTSASRHPGRRHPGRARRAG